MKKRMTKRLRSLIHSLDADRIAWMWADELPDGYAGKRFQPFWLRDEKRGGAVILSGSREFRTKDYPYSFVERAARRLKVNTGLNPMPGESKALDAIADRVRSKWPYLRAIYRSIYPKCDYTHWSNGELRFDGELCKVVADLGHVNDTELYWRSQAIGKIAKELSRMR